MNRRTFLAGAAAFQAQAGPGFEYRSLFCYAWDVLDEGVAAFARLVKETGLTHISLASSYHEGKVLTPHNPKRRVYFVEEGAIYFPPSPQHFGRSSMKPKVSRLTAGRDIWREITEACQAQGIRTTAWTVSLHNAHLGSTYPQHTTENAFGDRYIHALCPGQPAVVDYLRALAGNLASYATDAIDFESFEFIPYKHYAFIEKEGIEVTPMANLLLSLCFCEGCLAAAKRAAVDGGNVRAAVRKWLEAYFDGGERDRSPVEAKFASIPGLTDYLQVRFGILEHCLSEVAAAVHTHKKKVIYMIMRDRFPDYTAGIDLGKLARHVDAIEYLFYARRPEQAPQVVREIRTAAGTNVNVYLIVRPGHPDAKEATDVARLTQATFRAGAKGISYYNFGLFERSHMNWVRQAVRACCL